MSPQRTDRWVRIGLHGPALVAVVVVALIAGLLVVESLGALRAIGAGFITDRGWQPARDAADGAFRITPMVVATLLVTAGAVLLATPLGVASALFTRFYAPAPVARAYRRLIELLAGIPGVLFGFWGMMVVVPLLATVRPPGASILAAMLVLALMILPTIALLTDSTLRALPRRYLDGAAALGLSRWGTIAGVVLPAARGGIATAVILACGRAIGETLAVVMVIGNQVQFPDGLLAPARALTGNIALEMGYASGDHRAALFLSGLVLLLMVAVLVGLASRLGGHHGNA